jgi:hypothetical protein
VRRLAALGVLLAAVAAGCGSSSAPTVTVGAARTFHFAGFNLPQPVAGKPARLSFRIDQPSGGALTAYRTGAGPHTGVHVIFVRDDLGAIVHKHPPITADGNISEEVVFPTAGRYRMVVDVYPNLAGPLRNFQLFRWVTVGGKPAPSAPPPNRSTVTVDGDRFALRSHPRLRAIEAAFLNFSVTDRNGKPARFTPWFGALAHAIFFREGSLDYFHTHVCGAGATGCTSALGGTRVTGSSTAPGVLRVGLLLPVAGTWRLFLQSKVNGRVVTAPFTLVVR